MQEVSTSRVVYTSICLINLLMKFLIALTEYFSSFSTTRAVYVSFPGYG